MMASSNNKAVAFNVSSVNSTDFSLSRHPPVSSSSALLIAVVEWDKEATQERQRCKVPLRAIDLRRPPHVSGADLAGAVFRRLHAVQKDCFDHSDLTTDALMEQEDRSSPAERTTPISMLRIYDPQRGDYVPLDPSLPDIVTSFGKRTRLLWGATPPSPIPPHPRPQPQTRQIPDPGPWLALPGLHYAYDLVGGSFEVGGLRLRIHQTCDPISRTSGTVWDGAVLLSRLLEIRPALVHTKRVLELGAGCGLVGLAAAALGARNVCLTDLEYCLERLEWNVRENRLLLLRRDDEGGGCEVIECRACDWLDPPRHLWALEDEENKGPSSNWDVILAADCVWMEELVEPFLNTLDKITKRHRDARVLLAYQRRGQSTHQAFWAGLHQVFRVEVVLEEALNQPPALMLLSCRRL